jgi:hypothetical protein
MDIQILEQKSHNARLLFSELGESIYSWQGKQSTLFDLIRTSNSLELENNYTYFYFNKSNEDEILLGVEIRGSDSRILDLAPDIQLIDLYPEIVYSFNINNFEDINLGKLLEVESDLRIEVGQKRDLSPIWRLKRSHLHKELLLEFFRNTPF